MMFVKGAHLRRDTGGIQASCFMVFHDTCFALKEPIAMAGSTKAPGVCAAGG
jgi:hypothetical protein